jgi:hypothetical protein
MATNDFFNSMMWLVLEIRIYEAMILF